MQGSIYNYRNYKLYLKDWLLSRPGRGRGEKKRIAEALRCHTAYITHVFSGSAHLSMEQASDLSTYLGHRPDEQHFLLLLVQLARAGNAAFKTYIDREIHKALDAQTLLKNRLEFKRKLEGDDQSTYYSSWHYGAIHALVSVPSFQTPEAIAKYLRLPLQKVNGILDFLVTTGVVVTDRGQYHVGTTSIHLGNDSPMISKHHTNWRVRTLQSLDQPQAHDLHYSSVVSISRQDVPKARAIMIKAIEEIRTLVAASAEEEVYAYGMDLFGLK